MAGINEGWGGEQGDEGYKDGERVRETERSALVGVANTFLIKTVSRRN